MDNHHAGLVKWLQYLFYIQLVGLLLTLLNRLSLITNISFGGSWITWAQRGVNLATTVCLFLLPMRYRKAAIFQAAWLVCSLMNTLLLPALLPRFGIDLYWSVSSVLGWATAVLSFIALFLEYHTHAALSGKTDAKKWRILFICSLLVSLITSVAAAMLTNVLSEMVQNGITWGISLYNLVASLMILMISIAYLALLARTIQNVKSEECTYG